MEQNNYSNALLVTCYFAGCSLAAAIFPPSFSSLSSLALSAATILFVGLIISLLLFAVTFVFSSMSGGTPFHMLPLWLKLLFIPLVPAVILLLLFLLS